MTEPLFYVTSIFVVLMLQHWCYHLPVERKRRREQFHMFKQVRTELHKEHKEREEQRLQYNRQLLLLELKVNTLLNNQ